jgi:SulP family sulfate permease
MAYAMLAGLPPVMGLYASILPMILYALTGSSRQVSVAPVSLDSIMVLTGVSVLAQAGTQAFVGLAILLAAMIGGIQLLMGLAGLGFVVNFLSYPVLTGFAGAAAILTALAQLPHLFGVAPTQGLRDWLAAPLALGAQINPWTLGIALISIVALTGLKRWAPRLPGPLAVLGLGTAAVWLGGLDGRDVQIVGEIPSGLPDLALPPMDLATVQGPGAPGPGHGPGRLRPDHRHRQDPGPEAGP